MASPNSEPITVVKRVEYTHSPGLDHMTTLENECGYEVSWSEPPKSHGHRVQEGLFLKGKQGGHFQKIEKWTLGRQKQPMCIACIIKHPRTLPYRAPIPLLSLPARLEPLCLLRGTFNVLSFISPKVLLTYTASGDTVFPEQALMFTSPNSYSALSSFLSTLVVILFIFQGPDQ